MEDENRKEFRFGNGRFHGLYRPGEFEFNFPDELSRQEFEDMFRERMESLQKLGREFMPFDDEEVKTKKEKLKPLSIRVKAHTKEFFKKGSILSARDVLELYEDYNNGSEAFIDSLLEDEKRLEKELKDIQERLHNAQLFKDKLNDLNIEKTLKNDEDKLSALAEIYEDSEIKVIGASVSSDELKDDIMADIELYNTKKVVSHQSDYLEIETANALVPVVYFFKKDFSAEDLEKAFDDIENYCSESEIEFCKFEDGDE